MPFGKNMGTHLSNKNIQKRLDSAKKSITDAKKTTSKGAIQKIAEATGDLIGTRFIDKITSASKSSSTTNLLRNYIHKIII